MQDGGLDKVRPSGTMVGGVRSCGGWVVGNGAGPFAVYEANGSHFDPFEKKTCMNISILLC